MKLTTEQTEQLAAAFRTMTPTELNQHIAAVRKMQECHPTVITEVVAETKALLEKQIRIHNQMREIWHSGQEGYMPRGCQETL